LLIYFKSLEISKKENMILLFIILFVVGVCISFSGVLIIAKNTDIRLGWSGEKDFFLSLSPLEWGLSLFLIIVGGGMIYLSCKELLPYLIGSFELK
jgi:polyprenol-phosphate-mannose synthase domain 2